MIGLRLGILLVAAAALAVSVADAAPDSVGGRKGRGVDLLQRLHRHNLRGNAAFEEGKLDQALREYVEAQGLAPNDPRVLYNLGNAFARQGKAEEASAALERAARETEDRTLERDARYNRGLVQMDAEDLQGALSSFARALTLDPADAEARRNLEVVLRRLQQQQQQQSDQNGSQDRKDQEQGPQQQKQQQPQQQGDGQPQPRPDERERDPQREATRQLLKALANAEKEALRKALRQKLPNLRNREEDW